MFLFDVQRFGGGPTQTTVPEHFADRTKFPGLDTATNQQMDFNALASQLSTGLLQQALASSGYKINQTQPAVSSFPSPNTVGTTVGNNSLNKLTYASLPESWAVAGNGINRENNWDVLAKQMVANRGNYGSVDEWKADNIKNTGWMLGSNGQGKWYGLGNNSNSEEMATAIAFHFDVFFALFFCFCKRRNIRSGRFNIHGRNRHRTTKIIRHILCAINSRFG